jgi:hypothetical protein
MDEEKVKGANRITRRNFLKRSLLAGTGAALVGPAIIPARVLGAGAPSNRIAIGMIGLGRQAMGANLRPFLTSPDTQVVAACDVDSWRLDQAVKAVEDYYAKKNPSGTFKGCRAYRDFRELLARSDIDAVMVSVPDHWHVPISIAAMKAGKDVSCEKPLTLCIAEGRALCEAAKKYNRVTRTDSEFRSIRIFSRACELVRNGRIGQIKEIYSGVPIDTPAIPPQPDMPVPEELDYDMWLGPAAQAPYTEKRVHTRHDQKDRPGWMRIRDYCNGMISNWGAHLNDIVQWGNNTERTGPVEVEGKGEFTEGLWNTVRTFEVHYRYKNGVRLSYKSERPYVRFVGSDGWIQAEYTGSKLTAQPESILKSELGPNEIHLETTDEKTDFIKAVKARSETLEPFEVGHRTTSLCQIGLIAIMVGKKLTWDPDAERFTNDESANKLLGREMRAPWTL